MKMFTDKAIKTAKERVQGLIIKLVNTRPTDQWLLQDIEGLMFYLKDYMDELESLENEREENKLIWQIRAERKRRK